MKRCIRAGLRVYLVVMLCIVSMLGAGQYVFAEDGESTNTEDSAKVESSSVQESRVVRIACGMNDALYLDEYGDPQGIGLYYVRQLAWNMNWTMEYVECSYSEGLKKLADGSIDLMFPVGKDDDPEGKLLYSEFIGGYQQIGLFAKADADIFYEDYDGFDQKRVGLSIGGNSIILDAYAKEHDFTYTPVELNTIQDKIDALNSGDVDLIAFSTLNTVEGGKLVAVLDQVPFYFCTAADNQELMQEVNMSMSQSMVKTPDVVSTMYQDMLKGYNTISFTKEEDEKIQKADTIVFGVYKDCLPLAGVNDQGECVGIYVDVLREIAAASGLNIKVKPIEDSNRLYSYMDDGTVDFVIGVQELRFSSENADNYLASNGIADYTTVAVSTQDYQFDENHQPSFVLTKARNYLEDFIYSNFPQATIRYVDTRRECLDQVQQGKADVTCINTWEYSYETKNPRYQNLMEWENLRTTSVFGLGGTRQSDLELLSILEKTLSQISDEKIADIITANLNIPYQSYTFADRIYAIRYELLIGGLLLVLVLGGMGVYLHVKRTYIRDLIMANNAKGDFLSRMSHELRTPLNAINGYAAITTQDALRGEMEQQSLVENMGSIQKASDYLLGIIQDILDVQQMETGRITLNKSEINLTEYMRTIVHMIQPMADEKKITFTYTMINGERDNYLLDGLRMQQVLFNILYNAVKFTAEGGQVTMTSDIANRDANYVTIRFIIADTGIGMSREFLETKLFQKFAQENQNITSPYAGCGNGLAISKELVTLMGGDITCESEQGKGTTFTITVKTEYRRQEQKRVSAGQKVEPEQDVKSDRQMESDLNVESCQEKRLDPGKKSADGSVQKKPISEYDLTGVRVLMCEDNEMNQRIEKRLLERMHCEVDIAADGQIGLEKFRESASDYYGIVLMDIRMPNMDGLDATKAIRALAREDAKRVPILAVSANAFEEDVQKSLAAGMNEHLSKPVDGRVLYAKIKEYCEV